jgi:putative FmdB family regulatory protein
MPLYEYKCENCGELFEVMQKFADAPLTVHEKCGGGPVERLISAPTFNFKGSGWYVNDYAKSGSSGPNGGENKGEKKKDSSEGAGSKEAAAKSDSGSSSKSTDSSSSGTPAPAAPSTSSDKH